MSAPAPREASLGGTNRDWQHVRFLAKQEPEALARTAREGEGERAAV